MRTPTTTAATATTPIKWTFQRLVHQKYTTYLMICVFLSQSNVYSKRIFMFHKWVSIIWSSEKMWMKMSAIGKERRERFVVMIAHPKWREGIHSVNLFIPLMVGILFLLLRSIRFIRTYYHTCIQFNYGGVHLIYSKFQTKFYNFFLCFFFFVCCNSNFVEINFRVFSMAFWLSVHRHWRSHFNVLWRWEKSKEICCFGFIFLRFRAGVCSNIVNTNA